MRLISLVPGILLTLLPLVDAFETILQPRRVVHRFRFARLYYRLAWALWWRVAVWFCPGRIREAFLSIFGPISLLGLFAAWIGGLIFGFALILWAVRTPLPPPEGLGMYVYVSGSNFFTLGIDLSRSSGLAKTLGVIEGGLGFAFLAVIVGYLPVLYQAFSRREVTISLLDARAGSPPTATQFLLRLAQADCQSGADRILAEWEQWAAELLESHLSFPVLSFFRSQHGNQSWLSTLTMILDTCALLLVLPERRNPYQARLTFAVARHAAVDLALVLKTSRVAVSQDRLPPERRRMIELTLREAGWVFSAPPDVDARLAELRGMYEPFIEAIATLLLFAVPPVLSESEPVDNWQRSPWVPRAPAFGKVAIPGAVVDEHF